MGVVSQLNYLTIFGYSPIQGNGCKMLDGFQKKICLRGMKAKYCRNGTLRHPELMDNPLLGIISRICGASPDDVEDSPVIRKALVNASNDLTGREAMAIILRAVGMTYRGAGKIMGVSGERVRYVESKGLRKLRHPDKISFLRRHIDRCKKTHGRATPIPQRLSKAIWNGFAPWRKAGQSLPWSRLQKKR